MMEILVALVIMSLGALGSAGLQLTSRKAGHEAQQHLTATFLLNDIVEKMRNNPGALATYAAADVGGGTISAQPSPNCTSGSACTSTQLAAHDLWQWEQAIDGAAVKYGSDNVGGLVSPTGCITNSSGQVQVVISWYSTTALADTGTEGGGVNTCGTASANRRQIVLNTFIN